MKWLHHVLRCKVKPLCFYYKSLRGDEFEYSFGDLVYNVFLRIASFIGAKVDK